MNHSVLRRFFCVLFVAALALPVAAKTVVIKLATITPQNSPWGEGLNRLAADWKRISNGEVELRIYHGGVAGGESDMIRKMKLNQIQGGVFTSVGLNQINPDVLTLSIPLLIRNDAELDYVLEKASPSLAAGFERRGYRIIAWSKAGWLRVLSKKPVLYPEDLKRQRLAVGPDDQSLIQAYKALGFQIVTVTMSDSLTALSSGMVDAVQSSVLGMASYQWFGMAKNLLDIDICPFIGGIVLNQSAWNAIPERYRPDIENSIRKLEDGLDADTPKLDAQAMAVMKKNGLVVPPMTADARQKWNAEFEAGTKRLIGTTFSAEMYGEIQKDLREFRAK